MVLEQRIDGIDESIEELHKVESFTKRK